jgi:hypothetical protein
MWHINEIHVADGSNAQIFGGYEADMQIRSLGARLGPEGSMYVVSIQGVGALTLTDVGNNGGPGAGAVQINNSQDYWYYDGEGEVVLNVDSNGVVTFSGGVETATANLLVSMTDMNILTPYMFAMVAQSPTLITQWQQGAIETLDQMGFPQSSMINMDGDCCVQFMKFLESITFPKGFQLSAQDAKRSLEAHRTHDYGAMIAANPALGGWWACTWCQVGVAAGVALLVAIVLIAIAVAAPEAALAGAIAAAPTSATIAAACGLTAAQVGTAVAAAAGAGVTLLVDRAVEGLCELAGACEGVCSPLEISSAASN